MDNFMDKLAERYNAGEMIKANTEADTAQMQNLHDQVEAYEAVLQEMRKLNYKNTELTEKMYSLVDESIEKVRTLSIEASEGGANTELISREMSDAVTGALNEALNNMDSQVARTISESLAAALAQPTEEIASVKESSAQVFTSIEDVKNAVTYMKDSVEQNKSILQTLQLGQEANRDTVAAVNDNVSVMTQNVVATKETVDTVGQSVSDIKASIQDTMEGIAGQLQTLSLQVEAVNAQAQANAQANEGNATAGFDEEAKNYVTNIWNSVEATRVAVNGLMESLQNYQQQEEQKLQAAPATDTEDLKSSILEMAATTGEIENQVKNLKAVTEDTKATLKQSLESSMYGLKDNTNEIVKFLQRIYTEVTTKEVDPDAEQKEEEAKQKEEEKQKALEERFKQTEDFMHKESVKVYRNVQAVINEKGDQQTSGLETKVKANAVKIGQVKAVAIIAAVLSGLSLAVEVLSVFGIL